MRGRLTPCVVLIVGLVGAASIANAALPGPIVVQVNATTGQGGGIVVNAPFTVPQQAIKATITAALTGQPQGTTLQAWLGGDPSHGATCSEHMVPVLVGSTCYCYPKDPLAFPVQGAIATDFTEATRRCNGRDWILLVEQAGGPSAHITGTITIAFTIQLQVPASIIVTKPAAGSVVAAVAPFEVAWKKLGQMAATVRIELIPEVEPQAKRVLVSSTPNDGSQSCTVPTGYPGTVKIRVVTTDNKVSGESGPFQIPPPGHGPM